MNICGTILRWGNSFGLRLTKSDLERLNIHENEEVEIDIRKKEDPLRELFGAKKHEGKIGAAFLKKARAELEPGF
ncbi:MAG: hypothetical protein ABIH83_02510 [Candidatus Micrarchaeota archaeon]